MDYQGQNVNTGNFANFDANNVENFMPTPDRDMRNIGNVAGNAFGNMSGNMAPNPFGAFSPEEVMSIPNPEQSVTEVPAMPEVPVAEVQKEEAQSGAVDFNVIKSDKKLNDEALRQMSNLEADFKSDKISPAQFKDQVFASMSANLKNSYGRELGKVE